MPVPLFPDNTVLINFALINRMDLLNRLANGNGRWCATVAAECAESARHPHLTMVDPGYPWGRSCGLDAVPPCRPPRAAPACADIYELRNRRYLLAQQGSLAC